MRKWLVLLIFLGLLGGAGAYRVMQMRGRGTAQSISTLQLESGLPVRVAVVESRDVATTVAISGQIEAWASVAVAPKVSDRVEVLHVGTGERVTKGQLLVTLETTMSKLAVEQARASEAEAAARLERLRTGTRVEEVAAAKAQRDQSEAQLNLRRIEYERQKKLYAEQVISQERLDEAENMFRMAEAALAAAQATYEMAENGPRVEDIKVAEAQLALAAVAVKQREEDLDDRYLRASVDGVVTAKRLEVGDLADVMQTVFEVLQIDKVYLVVDVSELYAPLVGVGMAVEVTVDALKGERFVGEVAEVNPQAESVDRSFRTKIAIENKEGRLKPGMFGRAHVVTASRAGALVAPLDAIRHEGDASYVLRVNGEGIVERQAVEVGGTFGELVEVTGGVAAGEQVISLTQEIIEVGTKVTVE